MKKHTTRLGLGILLGVFFIFLALRKVDFAQMWHALMTANYWYLLPAVPILFLSHFLRALRWRYLLDPIKRLDTWSLFSSLVIGYSANIVVPAHLGEILRAYVLSKKRGISASSTFATIVMERIIDVFTLLGLMILTVFFYPFPQWLKDSGYIMFAGALGLFLLFVLSKKYPSKTQAFLGRLIRPLPKVFQQKIWIVLEMFLSGIVPLKHRGDYVVVSVMSMLIWACYGLIFYFGLQAFDFVKTFDLPWSVSLVLLVITTIAIVVPSSPGYVGTYHYLCQVCLGMFGISAGPALSFAVVVHGINFLPVLVLGLILCYFEGIGITTAKERVSAVKV